SLVYCHTHPHQDEPQFSAIDDATEADLKTYLANRRISAPHVALLVCRQRIVARQLGEVMAVRVVEVGESIAVATATHTEVADVHDRQVRAFGVEGQARIGSTKVAVIGLGGTGSLVTQQLARLGVQRFILVDHDVVETTNLNRLVGAYPDDVGVTSKV